MIDQNSNPPDRLPEDEGAIVPSGKGEILLYQTEDGRMRVECRFQDETIWLSQALMAELYQIGVGTVNHHLKAIYDDKELDPRIKGVRYEWHEVKRFSGRDTRVFGTENAVPTRLRYLIFMPFVSGTFMGWDSRDDLLSSRGREARRTHS